MNKFKGKLFSYILYLVIVASSLVMFFSSVDTTQQDVVVSEVQDIVHTSSKWILIVSSILALLNIINNAQHNAEQVKHVKNTYRPR
jgi:TRAP-type C4-dicarboxylate transport system permease small subunit